MVNPHDENLFSYLKAYRISNEIGKCLSYKVVVYKTAYPTFSIFSKHVHMMCVYKEV